MTKTIEEWRDELQAIVKISVDEASRLIANSKEEILIAFMAKYSLQPNECIVCYSGDKFWVERKETIASDSVYELIKCQKAFNILHDKYQKLLDEKKIEETMFCSTEGNAGQILVRAFCITCDTHHPQWKNPCSNESCEYGKVAAHPLGYKLCDTCNGRGYINE